MCHFEVICLTRMAESPVSVAHDFINFAIAACGLSWLRASSTYVVLRVRRSEFAVDFYVVKSWETATTIKTE